MNTTQKLVKAVYQKLNNDGKSATRYQVAKLMEVPYATLYKYEDGSVSAGYLATLKACQYLEIDADTVIALIAKEKCKKQSDIEATEKHLKSKPTALLDRITATFALCPSSFYYRTLGIYMI